MAKTAKLREKARDQERKGNWKDALALYEKVVEAEPDDDPDLTLLNKIGDLRLRAGRIDGAVQAWERAAASYAETGLPNNAIALCRKVQRVAPDRIEVYRQLGQLSAANGFVADARENFLAYAERKQRLGDLDASFAALAEFADLFPDDTAVRRSLAEQLASHEREEEAGRQYLLLLEAAERQGDSPTAAAARERLAELGVEADLADVPAEEAEEGEGDADDAATLAGLEPTGMEVDEPDDLEPLPLLDMEPQGDAGGGGPGAAPAEGLDLPEGADEELAEIAPLEGLEATALEASEERELDELPALDVEGADLEGALLDIDASPAADGVEDGRTEDRADAGVDTVREEDELAPLELQHPEAEEAEEPEAAAPVDEALEIEIGAEPPVGEPGGAEGGVGAAPHEVEVEEPLAGEPAAELAPEPVADARGDALSALEADPGDLQALEVLLGVPEDLDAAAEAAARAAPRALAERGDHGAALAATQLLLDRWPRDVRLLQKRAEYAFRAGDRPALLRAYVALADRLEEKGERNKAAAVRQRVRDLDPQHPSLAPPAAEAPEAPAPEPVEEYVDLGALILGDQPRRESTRFVVPEEEPSGDEDRDFSEMLSQFRTKVAENIAVEDSASHFDLGLAFKDMGLIDEAIGQFQVALRGGANPLSTLEVLGQCFSEKGQHAVAVRVLERALKVRGATDGDLVGVLYQLACCEAALGREDAAREHFERVLAVDVRFRDASDRLAGLGGG